MPPWRCSIECQLCHNFSIFSLFLQFTFHCNVRIIQFNVYFSHYLHVFMTNYINCIVCVYTCTLCLKKRANFGELQLRQAQTNFDYFWYTASEHF